MYLQLHVVHSEGQQPESNFVLYKVYLPGRGPARISNSGRIVYMILKKSHGDFEERFVLFFISIPGSYKMLGITSTL